MQTQASGGALPEEVQRAVDRFKVDGYVVMENVLPRDFVRELHDAYMAALNEKKGRYGIVPVKVSDAALAGNDTILERPDFKPQGGNHDVNRWNMHLPSTAPFIDSRIIAHPQVLPVIKALVGDDAVAYSLASDTPDPGSTFQNLHQDFGRYGLSLNIPLIDVKDENAPLEIWTGAHQPKRIDDPANFTPDVFFYSEEELRKVAEAKPVRMCVPAGSFVLRDHRLVHRGTANLGKTPRPTLSIYYIPALPSAPYRWAANTGSRLCRYLRERGRGTGPGVKDQKMVLRGNLMGLYADELSSTDRNYRRPVPRALWSGLTPEAKRLMRYATVEGGSDVPTRRSLGMTIALVGMLVSRYRAIQ